METKTKTVETTLWEYVISYIGYDKEEVMSSLSHEFLNDEVGVKEWMRQCVVEAIDAYNGGAR